MRIRAAVLDDAPAMGRLMVGSWLSAHQRHVPAEAFRRRVDEWTPQVSARGWARLLDALADDSGRREVLLVAEEQAGDLVALVYGAPADDETSAIARIVALYVATAEQRRGVGRAMLLAASRALEDLDYAGCRSGFSRRTSLLGGSTRPWVGSRLRTGCSTRTAIRSRRPSTPGRSAGTSRTSGRAPRHVVRPHLWDLRTSTSQPGEDGSKPCSTSQRIAVRLRSDHQARITSSVDVGSVTSDDVAEAVLVSERQAREVVHGIALASLGPVDHAGDLVSVDEHVGDLQVAVREHRCPRSERRLGHLAVAPDQVSGQDVVRQQPRAFAVEVRCDLVETPAGPSRQRASCSRRAAAPAAAHAADDAVDGSPRRPSAVPGRAASASTGGFRHRILGVGIGAIVIASTSTSVRAWSASIFRNTSPTRRVARS